MKIKQEKPYGLQVLERIEEDALILIQEYVYMAKIAKGFNSPGKAWLMGMASKLQEVADECREYARQSEASLTMTFLGDQLKAIRKMIKECRKIKKQSYPKEK